MSKSSECSVAMSIKNQFGDGSDVKRTIEAEYDGGSNDVPSEKKLVTANTACCLPDQ